MKIKIKMEPNEGKATFLDVYIIQYKSDNDTNVIKKDYKVI